MRAVRTLLLALAAALLILPVRSAALQDPGAAQTMRPAFVSEPIAPTVTQAARDVPDAPPPAFGVEKVEEDRQSYPRPGDQTVPRVDPGPAADPLLSLQGQSARPGTRALTASLNFAGQGYSGVQPPDTVGAVGPSHYVQLINTSAGSNVAIYDKASGAPTRAPFALKALGVNSGNCTSGFGDGDVVFDRQASRWVMSELAGTKSICMYISQTADPAGTYIRYEFIGSQLPDYPKIGVWSNAYYITTNESAPTIYAFDRARMLAGQTVTFQKFQATNLAGFAFQTLTPADIDGAAAPPAGSPGYFMRHRDDEVHNSGANDSTRDFLEVWQVQPDFATPANSVLSGPTNIGVASFDSTLCGLSTLSCIPQPSGINALDGLREVIMYRLQYRNFGSYATLVGNFAVDVTGTNQAGIRWFELRKSGAGAWQLYQEGTYAPDAVNRWMGSIAMDSVGNIALGYSVSSSSVYPGLRLTGRESTDPPGTMTSPETVIAAGAASNSSNRWGDYQSMSIDPVDDCTFWFTGEYSPATTWGTRVLRVKFDSCIAGLAGFTDSVLAAGVTTIKAAHITELRTRVDAVRVARGLTPVSWARTLAAGTSTIQAIDVIELRNALAAAYAHDSRTPPVYTNTTIAAGSAIRAVDIAELRLAVLAIEP